MTIEKLPEGTRGPRGPRGLVIRMVGAIMLPMHRRAGDRFQGMDLIYLHTVGAKTGQQRVAPVARVDDGHGGWLVCASAGGARKHPGWYYNIVAHPDDVQAEIAGQKRRVVVEQLAGAERDDAWRKISGSMPRFLGYLKKTDRTLPVLRLTPVAP